LWSYSEYSSLEERRIWREKDQSLCRELSKKKKNRTKAAVGRMKTRKDQSLLVRRIGFGQVIAI